MTIEARLAELGIVLPEPAAPVAAYVPVVLMPLIAGVPIRMRLRWITLPLMRKVSDSKTEAAPTTAL